MSKPANHFVDGDWAIYQRATATVFDTDRQATVTYRNDQGASFRVLVRQRPNPIGFAARLPGDKPKPTAKMRDFLQCLLPFFSRGAGNVVCPICKDESAADFEGGL